MRVDPTCSILDSEEIHFRNTLQASLGIIRQILSPTSLSPRDCSPQLCQQQLVFLAPASPPYGPWHRGRGQGTEKKRSSSGWSFLRAHTWQAAPWGSLPAGTSRAAPILNSGKPGMWLHTFALSKLFVMSWDRY